MLCDFSVKKMHNTKKEKNVRKSYECNHVLESFLESWIGLEFLFLTLEAWIWFPLCIPNENVPSHHSQSAG